jgi:hypothetical protein
VSRCSYELYVENYRAVRAALADGDLEALRSIRSEAARAHGVANLVRTLALIEAQRAMPERTKADVCGGMLCADRCADAVPPSLVALPGARS